MNILGIDPGRTGALAVLDTDSRSISVHDMPQTTIELHDMITELPLISVCVLEALHAGPQMGRTSVARMFEDYGVLKGALAWRSIQVNDVRPSVWKPSLNLSRDKHASREKAMQIFPDQADLFKRAKDHGRAEAALLAWYGLRWANDYRALRDRLVGGE